MSSREDDKKSPILEFADALLRREWRALRRFLLGLYLPGIPILFQNRSILGVHQVYVWAVLSVLFLILLLSEISSRPRPSSTPTPDGYTRTIRGLVSFGEDDATTFATLGRGADVARVVTALLDPQFRFGVLYAESGCGKTSLLQAGVLPELRKRGYTLHIDDVNNQEEPLQLVVRMLRDGAATAAIAGADSNPSGTEHPWLAQYDATARRVFLILDQFEQFFLHYGLPGKGEPFLSFMKQWWTLHPASQLRILVSVREDYLGKLAVIQERLEYVQTVHNHLRLRKFTPDDAVEVLRSMAAETNLVFHETAVRHACLEELASKEDGAVSPVDLQILAMGVQDLPIATRGFTAGALRALGGLEGALERYLTVQLANVPADRKAALAVLRLLSEPKRDVLTGWLSAAEMIKQLGEAYGAERVRKMIDWLANPGVRLTVEGESPEGKRYRLVHDRLVAAVLKASGQMLVETDRANALLNQRVSEYLSNARRPRYLLPWSEWRLIVRQQALVDWGSREAEKRELLRRSGSRVKAWAASGIASVAVLCLTWGTWEFQPRVLIWRTRQEFQSDVRRISDPMTLSEIATELAAAAVKAKNSELLNQAAAIVQKVGDEGYKSHAVSQISTALASAADDKGKDLKFLNQVVAVAQILDPGYRVVVLSHIATALASAGMKDSSLFDKAIEIAQKIDDPGNRASAVIEIATALASTGNKSKASELLDETVFVAQKIDHPEGEASVLCRIATATATADNKAKASKLFDHSLEVAQRIDRPQGRASVLSQIGTAVAAAGDKAEASKVFDRAVEATGRIEDPEAKALALSEIATALGAADNMAKSSVVFDQAVAAAQRIANRGNRFIMLSDTAIAMGTLADREEAPRLFDRAADLAQRIENPVIRSYAQGRLVNILTAAGGKAPEFLDRAVEITERIDERYARSLALIGVATALASAGMKDPKLFDKAVEIAQKIDDPGNRASAVIEIATALASTGNKSKASELLDEAQLVAQRIDRPDQRVMAISETAAAVAAAGDKAKASSLFEQAVEVASNLDALYKRPALNAITEEMLTLADKAKDPNLFDKAAKVAEGIDQLSTRAAMLGRIATKLAAMAAKTKSPGLLDQAMAIALKIDQKSRPVALVRELSWTQAYLGDLRAARHLAQGLPIDEEALMLLRIITGWVQAQVKSASE